MNEEEARETLKTMKENIDKKYLKTRNSVAIETVLKLLEKKDKIIDLTAEYISNITDCPFESEGKYLDCEKMCDVRTDKECWKQYFENKAKELLNK